LLVALDVGGYFGEIHIVMSAETTAVPDGSVLSTPTTTSRAVVLVSR
jgi:hypothetical protein